MTEFLLYPPVAFIISFGAVALFSFLTRNWAPRPKADPCSGKLEPYACGEEYKETRVEPDYKTFFPFAIFFTVLHVAGLTIATLAGVNLTVTLAAFAAVYVLAVLVVIGILYSK